LIGDLGRRVSLRLARLPNWLLLLATLVLAVIAFLYFTVWNVAMLFLYLYVLSKRTVRKIQLPGIVGGVVDQFGDPLSYAFVRLAPNQRSDGRQEKEGHATQADELGRFSFSVKPGFYRIQA